MFGDPLSLSQFISLPDGGAREPGHLWNGEDPGFKPKVVRVASLSPFKGPVKDLREHEEKEGAPCLLLAPTRVLCMGCLWSQGTSTE